MIRKSKISANQSSLSGFSLLSLWCLMVTLSVLLQVSVGYVLYAAYQDRIATTAKTSTQASRQ